MAHEWLDERYRPRRITKHALRRMAQRAISPDRIDALLRHGEEVSCAGGAVALTVSSELAAELRADGMPGPFVDRLCGIRAVVSGDGALITVMHRYRRKDRRRSPSLSGDA